VNVTYYSVADASTEFTLSEAERARHDITPLAKETSIPIVTSTEGQSPLCHFERAVGESRNLASFHNVLNILANLSKTGININIYLSIYANA